jgi:hypothetical protein
MFRMLASCIIKQLGRRHESFSEILKWHVGHQQISKLGRTYQEVEDQTINLKVTGFQVMTKTKLIWPLGPPVELLSKNVFPLLESILPSQVMVPHHQKI